MTGLFVQLSTLPPDPYLTDLIFHIRTRHPEIRDLAFTDVQPWDLGRLPDLAGFNVYVGAPPVPWYGPRPDTPTNLQQWMHHIAGVAGMLTPSYRWDQIYADQALAATHGWKVYVGSEVGIEVLGDHPAVRAGWEAYLIELHRRINRPTLWSPYAWDLWSSVSATRRTKVKAAMKTLVTNVKNYSQTAGLTRLDLQDGRGAQPSEPETDALNWYNLIKDCGAEVKINMELFASDLTPAPLEEIDRRRAFYATHNAPIGCCWEARDWLVPLHSNHPH